MKKSGAQIRLFSVLLLAVFFAFASYYLFIFVRCALVARSVPESARTPLMRVMIYGNSPETVSARFSLLDTSGREFAVLDRSWSGQALSVEFSSAAFGGKEVLFPLRIYSRRFLQDGRTIRYPGTRLTRYYMSDGEFPLAGSSLPGKARSALRAFAVFAAFQSEKFQSRYSRIYTLDLSGCAGGETYEISSNSSGGLSIARM